MKGVSLELMHAYFMQAADVIVRDKLNLSVSSRGTRNT